MNFPKYTGTVHPKEYVNEMIVHCHFRQITDEKEIVKYSKMMVDATIEIPSNITSCEDLINELKNHITFKIYKNSCKRKLHLLRFNLERNGGDPPKFISDFLSLCRGAEIDDIDHQKNHLYYSLPNDFFRDEFIKKFDEINSMNDLLVCFEQALNEYSRFILNGSIVALKHVPTGKYLSSSVKHYVTGSKNQMIFCGKSLRDSNSVWTVKCFNSPEFISYGSTIFLQHNNTGNYLEIVTNRHTTSPISNYTEVSCGANNNYSDYTWILERNKSSGSQDKYLKSRDTIILKNTYTDYLTNQQRAEVLRSHDVTFTVDNEGFQEVFAHGGEITENDEWCIEHIE